MRVGVFDRTQGTLTATWRAGTVLYRGLGRLDATFGATSWAEALDWLAGAKEPIEEIQYWGHGRWGRVLVDRDVLSAESMGGPLRRRLEAVRERLAPDALVWLRTCEAFGARAGHDFAQRLADFFGVRVAGHTYVIHAWQSGLHGLRPGAKPDWSASEGLAEGTPEDPNRAHNSVPGAPRTITCFTGVVPPDWFT